MAWTELRPYFLVVRTEGITETTGAPKDAILDTTYWHPGDQAWASDYHESLDAAIAQLEDGGFYKLVQITAIKPPYE